MSDPITLNFSEAAEDRDNVESAGVHYEQVYAYFLGVKTLLADNPKRRQRFLDRVRENNGLQVMPQSFSHSQTIIAQRLLLEALALIKLLPEIVEIDPKAKKKIFDAACGVRSIIDALEFADYSYTQRAIEAGVPHPEPHPQ